MFLSLPPRVPTPEWWSHWWRSVLILAVLIVTAIGFFAASVVASRSREAALTVVDTGERATGTLLAADYTKSKNSTSYYVSYHFEVNGVAYEERHGVNGTVYHQFQEGAPVEIAYDLLEPATSYMVCERDKLDTRATAVILAVFGFASIVAAIIVGWQRRRTRWLWLHGVEVCADLVWGSRSSSYRFQHAGEPVEIRARYGTWVVRSGDRPVLLVDPDRPRRATALTPQMLTAERLAEATEPSRRLLAAPPRAENPVWRKSIRPTGSWVAALALALIALFMVGCTLPDYVARRSLRAGARQSEGIVVERTKSEVQYVVEGRRGSFGITTRQMATYPIGRAVTVHLDDERLYLEQDLSTERHVGFFVLAAVLAALGGVVLLGGLRTHWRGRVLWREGLEVHAMITLDHTNKGVRHVNYRFAHAGLEGKGSRHFETREAPLAGSADAPTVVVLVDPLDARRSRLVLQGELPLLSSFLPVPPLA